MNASKNYHFFFFERNGISHRDLSLKGEALGAVDEFTYLGGEISQDCNEKAKVEST